MSLDEQQQAPELDTTEATPAPDLADRDEMLKHLREVMPPGALEQDQAALREAKGEPEPVASVPGEDPDEPKVARLLREREKAHAERMASEDYATKRRQEADAERQRILEETRTEARKEFEAERERLRKEFAADPLERIKQIGTPEEVADAIQRAGSPEYRAQQQLQRELAELREKASAGEDARKQFTEWKAEQARAAQEAENQKVYDAFLTEHASKEKAPYLHARYDREEIIERGNRLADQWRKSGLEYRKDFDLKDISEYLESEAKKRLSALASPAPQVRAVPGSPAGNASKVSANGSRTIPVSASSERRAVPKPFNEMNDEEQRKDLLEAAQSARRAFGG